MTRVSGAPSISSRSSKPRSRAAASPGAGRGGAGAEQRTRERGGEGGRREERVRAPALDRAHRGGGEEGGRGARPPREREGPAGPVLAGDHGPQEEQDARRREARQEVVAHEV